MFTIALFCALDRTNLLPCCTPYSSSYQLVCRRLENAQGTDYSTEKTDLKGIHCEYNMQFFNPIQTVGGGALGLPCFFLITQKELV